MRIWLDFRKLRETVMRRAAGLQSRADKYALSVPELRPSTLAYCVIELDNLVVCSLRDIMIGSLLGAKTASGVRVAAASSFTLEGEAAAYVLSVLNSARYNNLGQPPSVARDQEQVTRSPKDVHEVLRRAGASNISSLSTAMNLNLGIFSEIARFRHFYAHRNEDTYKKARNRANQIGVVGFNHIDEACLSRKAGSISTLYSQWAGELKTYVDVATL